MALCLINTAAGLNQRRSHHKAYINWCCNQGQPNRMRYGAWGFVIVIVIHIKSRRQCMKWYKKADIISIGVCLLNSVTCVRNAFKEAKEIWIVLSKVLVSVVMGCLSQSNTRSHPLLFAWKKLWMKTQRSLFWPSGLQRSVRWIGFQNCGQNIMRFSMEGLTWVWRST